MTSQFNENDIRVTVAFMNLLVDLHPEHNVAACMEELNKILEPMDWQLISVDSDIRNGQPYVMDVYVVEFDNS